MEKEDQKILIKLGNSSCVRFSEDEYEKIQKISKLTKKSIPKLLKDKFFLGSGLTILMRPEYSTKFMSEFNKVGNNLNQLARKANMGKPIDKLALLEIKDQLHLIFTYIARFNGGSKNHV